MTASPSDAILDHPVALYEHAVLHIAVACRAGMTRLLFGFVELLPLEVPAPLHDGVVTGPRLKKSGWRVFADHVPLAAASAIEWYADARGGKVTRPGSEGRVSRAGDPDAITCEPLSWSGEPIWPEYVIAGLPRLPFLSRWHKTPRMHHLMPASSLWDYIPEESSTIDEFLESEMGFRRSGWTQLAESIHLVAPNPFFRQLREQLDDQSVANRESVCISVEPRNCVALPGLLVDLAEHRPTGAGRSETLQVDANPRTAMTGQRLHNTSATVRLASGGLLETRESASFFREIRLMMNSVRAKRSVRVMDHQGRGLETYEIAVAQPTMTTPTGVNESRSATDSLTTLIDEVSVRATADQLDQRWFAGDEDGARAFVRSLIHPAREQILIADPYLGNVEIQRYALGVSLAGVPVRLLTTVDGVSKGATPAVLANLAHWAATDPSLGLIEVRVMARGELHDRFLRADDRLYTLGNSLNALGDKGSLVMRIPDPTPIFAELERIWSGADPLEGTP